MPADGRGGRQPRRHLARRHPFTATGGAAVEDSVEIDLAIP
jgi:hypothetical protein